VRLPGLLRLRSDERVLRFGDVERERSLQLLLRAVVVQCCLKRMLLLPSCCCSYAAAAAATVAVRGARKQRGEHAAARRPI
jgi:hypothetical protein